MAVSSKDALGKGYAGIPVVEEGSAYEGIPVVEDGEMPSQTGVKQSKTMKATVTGYPDEDSRKELSISREAITKFLGNDFGKVNPNAPVTPNAPKTTATSSVSEPELQTARITIKQEVEYGKEYIAKDLDKVRMLPDIAWRQLESAGIDVEAMASQILDEKGNPEALKNYIKVRREILQKQKETELSDASAVKGKELGYVFTAEDEKLQAEKVAAINEKYKQQQEDIEKATYGLAAQKALNEKVRSGEITVNEKGIFTSKDLPYSVGAEIRKIMGDESAVKHNDELYAKTGRYNEREKVNTEIEGYRALEYMTMVAAAEGDDVLAKGIAKQTEGWQRRVLDDNPGFKKDQVINLISNYVYDKAKNSGYALTGYRADEGDIKEALQHFGIPENDAAGITPEDIKRKANPFLQFATAAVLSPVAGITERVARLTNSAANVFHSGVDEVLLDESFQDNWEKKSWLGKQWGGEAPQNSSLFKSQTLVEGSPTSSEYLMDVQNPDYEAGKINPDFNLGSVVGTISEGAGQLYGLGKGTGMVRGALKGTGLVKSAKLGNSIGMSAYLGITTWDDNARAVKEDVGDDPKDEGLRTVLTAARVGIEVLTEHILPDYQITDKLGFKGALTSGIVDLIQRDGIKKVSREAVSNVLLKAAKDWSVDVSKEAAEEVAGVYLNMIPDAIATPGKYENTNYNVEALQNGIAGGLSAILPVGAGSYIQAKQTGEMYKNGLYMTGMNPVSVINQIDQELEEGTITPQVANEKKQIVNNLASIVKALPDVSPKSGKPLTEKQKLDYTALRLSNSLLEKKIDEAKDDKVLSAAFKEFQKENEEKQAAILENRAPEGPVEESVVSTPAEGGSTGTTTIPEATQEASASALPAEVLDFEDDISESSVSLSEESTTNDGKENQLQGDPSGIAANAETGEANTGQGDNSVNNGGENGRVAQGGVEDGTTETVQPNGALPAANATAGQLEQSQAEEAGVPADAAIPAAGDMGAAQELPSSDATQAGTELAVDAAAGTSESNQGTGAMVQQVPEGSNGTAGPAIQDTGNQAVEVAAIQGANDSPAVPAETQAGRNADSFFSAPRTESEQAITEQVAPAIRERFDSAPKKVGIAHTRSLPTGERLRGRYILIPASAITPSHNPKTFSSSEGYPMLEGGRNPNDRDYSLDKNKNAVIARSQNYDGRAVDDVPTVDKNGIVIDGNDRTMSGQLAAEQGTDSEYLEALKEGAAKYGFTSEQVEEMILNGDHPRVVHVADTIQPYTTETYAKFNVATTKPKSALETAIQYGRTLPADIVSRVGNILDRHDDLADLYKSREDQRELANVLMRAAVINSNNVSQFFDDDAGTFTAEGKDLITNIMLSQILEEDSLRIIQQYKDLANKIARAAKNVFVIDKRGEYNLGETLNGAVKLYHNVSLYRDSMPSGTSRALALEQYLNQNSLFETDADETASVVQLYQSLANPAKTFFYKQTKEILERASPANSGFDLFGAAPPSKLELILTANQATEQYEQTITVPQIEPNSAGDQLTGGDSAVDENNEGTDTAEEGKAEEVPSGNDAGTEPVSIAVDPVLHPINERIESALKEVARIEAIIDKKAEKLESMRRKGQEKTPEYDVNRKVWQKHIEYLKEAKKNQSEARKEYDRVSVALAKKAEQVTTAKPKAPAKTSEEKAEAKRKADAKRKAAAKKTATAVRSKKITTKSSGKVLAADPLGIMAATQLFKVAGKTTWNASLELVALAIEKGTSLKIAIENGVAYIRDKVRGNEDIIPDSDYSAFRTYLGYDEVDAEVSTENESQAQYRERLFRQRTGIGTVPLSAKQFTNAESIIKAITEGRVSLPDAIKAIRENGKGAEATKEKIVTYISAAINGDPNKFMYDSTVKKIFQEDVRRQIAQKKKYNEIVNHLQAQRERNLTFSERQFIADEIKNYDLLTGELQKAGTLNKEAARAFVKRVADSAYVNDDQTLLNLVNDLDAKYTPVSHKDLEEYAQSIVEEFGPAEAENLARTGTMAPNKRQAVMAYVAAAYKEKNDIKSLQSILSRLAQDATAYGQGVEATKLVYQVLGLTGAKGADTYVQKLVAHMQEALMAAHRNEAEAYRAKIEELQRYIAEQVKTDKALATKVGNLLNKATSKNKVGKTTKSATKKKLGEDISKAATAAKGKLETPAQIAEMRKEIERATRAAYPMLDKAEVDDIVSDNLAKFDEHVKDINEGNLYEFYRDIMFPQQKDGDYRDTRIAEDIISVVNSAQIANGKIDDFTLDAIAQKYKIDLRSNGFVNALNELVERANEDEASQDREPSRMKDDIADLLRLHSNNRTTKDALLAIGMTVNDIANMPEAARAKAIADAKKFVADRYNALGLSNIADRNSITNKTASRIEEMVKLQREGKAEEALFNYYSSQMNTPLPTEARTDKDTRVAERIMDIVEASNTVNGPGNIDQLTLDALQREFDLTFVSPTFVDAVNNLVTIANGDANGRKGEPSKVKDDIAQLVRLYSIDNAVDSAVASIAGTLPDIVTQLASVRNGVAGDVVAYVQKQLSGLGLSDTQAQEVVDAVKSRYSELLKENANKYLRTHLGGTETKKDEKAEAKHKSFYEKVVEELNALELSDESYQQLFVEKYGLSPVTKDDMDMLRSQAEEIERWYKIAPNSMEYGAALEKFFNKINEKSPDYLTNIANGLRASKVLGSIWFTAKTARSNVSQIYTRGVTEFLRTVVAGRPDVNILKQTFPTIQRLFTKEKLDRLAVTASRYIWQGATPVSNLYEQEFANREGVNTRLEEFKNPNDNWYIRASKWTTKHASRIQNTIDSYGQLDVQEIVQYARIAEIVEKEMKADNPRVSSREIIEEAKRRFDLTDEQAAIDKARHQYNDLGIQVEEDSPRFKLRVAEIRREHRDAEALQFARKVARVDFWKETDRSAGKISAGIGGLQEQFLSAIRDGARPFVRNFGSKALTRYDAAMFQVVGFIGGTSRFNETKYESIIFYSMAKAAALQIAKKKALTEEEKEMISRKQLDVIVKGLTSPLQNAALLAMYYTLKSLVGGGDDEDKTDMGIYGSGDLLDPTQVGLFKQLPKQGFLIKGRKVPFALLAGEQETFWLNLYANVEDYARSNHESISLMQFMAATYNTLPESPLSSGTIGETLSALALPEAKMFPKLQEILFKKIGNYVAGFVPWYQRIAQEAYQTIDQRQHEQIEPTLPYDKSASPMEKGAKMIVNAAVRATFATGQALGLNSWIGLAGKLNKPASDYRGREVNLGLQYEAYSSVPAMFDGGAIKYDKLDDRLARAGAKVDYYSRYGERSILFKDTRNSDYFEENESGDKVQLFEGQQRLMTDNEFYEFRTAINKINGRQLEGKEVDWQTADDESVNSEFNSIQRTSYDYAKKGIEMGMTADQIIQAYESGEDITLPEPGVQW